MKPHFVKIKNSETKNSFYVDMEGPYHAKNKKIGEHIYGITLLIDNVPYHFEKYIPTKEEVKKFIKENEGEVRFSKGGFIYRLVPFTK
ncbi:MAG: hypothetical protein KKB77_07205 [Bacteroidetes bacterium]|nr:hypothetical protein [Bacteroidota bacterium]